MLNSITLLLPLALVPLQQQGSGDPPETSPYGAVEWGDFDGDGQEDLAFQAGDTVSALFAPDLYEALLEDLDDSVASFRIVVDFAVLRQDEAVVSGERDRLVLVDDDGLVELSLDTSSWPFSANRQVHGGFADAVMIDAWSSDDGNDHWIAGVDSTGATLYVATQVGATTTVTSMPSGSPFPIKDLELLDTDGDGTPEVGMCSTSSLVVYDVWDSLQMFTTSNASIVYQDLESVRQSNGTDYKEALVTLGTLSGASFLSTWQEGVVDNSQFFPAQHQFYTLGVGRHDSDTREDVVLADNGTESVFVLQNHDTGTLEPEFTFWNSDPTKRAVERTYLGSGGASLGDAATQTSGVTLVDVDHDGDGEAALLLHEADRHWIDRNPLEDAALDQAQVIEDWYVDDPLDQNDFGGTYNVDTKELHLQLTLPAATPGAYLDIVAWKEDLSGASVSPDTIDSQRVAISTGGGQLDVYLDLTDVHGVTNTVTGSTGWSKTVFLLFQFVEADDGTAIPAYCYAPTRLVLVPDSDGTGFGISEFGGSDFNVALVDPSPEPGETQSQGVTSAGNGGDYNCVPGGTVPQRP